MHGLFIQSANVAFTITIRILQKKLNKVVVVSFFPPTNQGNPSRILFIRDPIGKSRQASIPVWGPRRTDSARKFLNGLKKKEQYKTDV